MKGCFSALALFSITATSVFAASSRSLDLAQMTESAGSIVLGRVIEVRHTVDEKTGLPVQSVSLAVRERLKGEGGENHVFRRVDDQTTSFVEGDEVLLFLYPTSKLGLTSAVGLGQGSFRMTLIGGVRHLINSFNNRGLLGSQSSNTLQLRVPSALDRPTSGPMREE